ncbi:hypothetical protein C8R43DRAFT_1160586 [Mycena crocata]|nr:hypothetical protein C8R43DRAFT_1160586 [Mycena crocata]
MPASIPAGGMPRIAVVMARLMHQGQNYGIRPFVVPLNDGKSMHDGVSCRVLPDRSGTLLVGDLKSTLRPRIQFLTSIWRLGIGSATMAALCIPSLRLAACIRNVSNPQGVVVPILSFRSTQIPILRALSQAAVLEAFYRELRPYFSNLNGLDLSTVVDIRNGLAAVFKTLSVYHYRESSITLTDRSGARGLFVENQLVSLEMEIRGMTIAEGDVTVICIRLASELLLGRYSLPGPKHPNSPLALHEQAISSEMRELLRGMNSNHRSEEFNRLLLPRSMGLVLAIGQRMAYEAAVDAGVDPLMMDLYQTGAVIQDLAWYVESGTLSRKDAMAADDIALTQAFQNLDTFVEDIGCESCIHAPILSAPAWNRYVAQLRVHEARKNIQLARL